MIALGVLEVAVGALLMYLTFTGYSRDVWDILFQSDHASHQQHVAFSGPTQPAPPGGGGGGGSFGP